MRYLIIAESGLATIQLGNQIKTLNPENKIEKYNSLLEAFKNKSKFDYQAIFVDFANESEYHIKTFLNLLAHSRSQHSVISWLKTKINDDFVLNLVEHGLQVFCPLYPSKIQIRDVLTAQANAQICLTDETFTAIKKAALQNRKFQAPTAKETKILNCLFQFKTNEEIAKELKISVSSVKTHIGNLNHKFNTNNRNELRANAESYLANINSVRDRSQNQT